MSHVETSAILMTDLVGSTELGVRIGPAATDKLRRDHFEVLREAIAVSGGREVKNLGDGLMVAFSSASSAVICAVGIQQRIERRNRRSEEQLAIRIGLSIGDTTLDDGDYFGTPVVEAARLCDRAEGGQILARELVAKLSGGRDEHAFQPVGELELKGLPAPVSVVTVVWKPLDEKTPLLPLPLRVQRISQSGFVGRLDQRERLEKLFAEVTEGQRRFALIAGEPGIGKTRLAVEFCLAAHEQHGATVLYGRSDEETLLPYGPFVEALRHYVQNCSPAELRGQLTRVGGDIARLVPELSQRIPDLPAPFQGESETQRYRLFEAVTSLLAAASQTHPLVLLLDDLHWADKPTLLLLRHIARSAEQSPLLVLVTYRESELSRTHPLAETLADLRREHIFERLRLEGLGETDVGALIASDLGDHAARGFVHAVYGETEGNPFFIGEVIRHLVESRAVHQENGAWTSDRPLDELGIPEGVKEVIGRRLARLSDPANQVLSVASVVGRDFNFGLIERVSRLEQDQVLDAVEEAVKSNVVTEVRNGLERYSFSHALIRETLYEELSAPRRARLHRQIAGVLEDLYAGDVESHLPELAYHFCQSPLGGDVGRAIEYARRAGEWAVTQLAYEDAAAHYERALMTIELRDEPDENERCELLLCLGEVLNKAGNSEGAREAFQQAAEAARQLEVPELLARAALGLGGGFNAWGFVFDEALVGMLEEALEALGEQDSSLRVFILGRLAIELRHTGLVERREQLGTEAVATARRIGDAAAELVALYSHEYACWKPGAAGDRLAATDEILRLSKQLEDLEMEFHGHALRLGTLLELGKTHAVEAEIEICERLTEELRQPFYRWQTTVFRTGIALLKGELEETEGLAEEALRLGTPVDIEVAVTSFGAHLSYLRWIQGRLDELDPAAMKVWADQYPGIPGWRAAVAFIYSEAGLYDEAKAEYDILAAEDFGTIPRDGQWLLSLCLLAQACILLRDTGGAQVLYDLLLPHAELCATVTPGIASLGCVSIVLGPLAAALDRWPAAADHFEVAAQRNTTMEARPFRALTLRFHAQALLEKDEPGDRAMAESLIDEARTLGRELGMKAVVDACEEMRTDAQLASDRPHAWSFGRMKLP